MANRYGVSFSLKYANEMGIDSKNCLTDALEVLKVKRLRLMSYWDIHEPKPGTYNFRQLDWQFELALHNRVEVSLAIGLRQPRWPESHWPDWVKGLTDAEWQQSLFSYIEAVVKRYKKHPSLVSWQLENEAMLKTFGLDGNFDRGRLKSEFNLVKRLDPFHPIIMSTSDSWGLPFFGPKPDFYGFSVYRYFYDRGKYRNSNRLAIFYQLRALLIRLTKQRQVFIHELQAEPWGSKATVDMSTEEQFLSMNLKRVKEAIEFAQNTQLLPIDIWGLEWWYWLKTAKDKPEIWNYMKTLFRSNR